MTIAESTQLLEHSIPDPNNPDRRRFAMRRTVPGPQWFEGKLTERIDETAVYHGYPTDYVPAKVLRAFRDRGDISDAEYRAMVKTLA